MTEIINVHRDEQTYGQTFLTFRGSTIRVATVDEQGETWLVAQDIVQSLGNTDTEGTIRKIPSQHRCLRRVPTPGGPQRMITINGEGLRWLAYRSQKALKEELVEWVNEHFPAADEGTCDEGDPYAVLDTFSLGGLVLQLVDVDSKGKPWFLAKDPSDALGYRDPEGALRKLGEKQKRTKLIRTSVGPRRILTINEGGLYKLLLRSDKKEAEKFSDWVTDEVLPESRLKGYYAKPGTALAPASGPQLLAVLTRIEARLTHMDERLTRLDERVTRLEQGRTMFTALGGKVPARTLRAELEALTDEVARRKCCLPGTIMIALYKEVRLRHHVDYRARKQRAYERTGRRYAVLDFVERDDNLEAVYNLALEHFADLLERDLQPESTRDAVFLATVDPPDEEEVSLAEMVLDLPQEGESWSLGGVQ